MKHENSYINALIQEDECNKKARTVMSNFSLSRLSYSLIYIAGLILLILSLGFTSFNEKEELFKNENFINHFSTSISVPVGEVVIVDHDKAREDLAVLNQDFRKRISVISLLSISLGIGFVFYGFFIVHKFDIPEQCQFLTITEWIFCFGLILLFFGCNIGLNVVNETSSASIEPYTNYLYLFEDKVLLISFSILVLYFLYALSCLAHWKKSSPSSSDVLNAITDLNNSSSLVEKEELNAVLSTDSLDEINQFKFENQNMSLNYKLENFFFYLEEATEKKEAREFDFAKNKSLIEKNK